MHDRPLIILEMANNHMGDVEHGLRIIRAFADVVSSFPAFEFAFKLQYRDLDTFIHPNAPETAPHVKRFRDTRLREEDFLRLIAEMRTCGFRTACTPFDEPSVDLVAKHGFDYLKIGSCSLTDWPLLERIALYDLPIIASTAGASLDDLDAVVSFFEHRGKSLALLHCVALYPTPEIAAELNQLDLLRARYPQLRIGISEHGDPAMCLPTILAAGKGASIFEKHVALGDGQRPINPYSATPGELLHWLQAIARARLACGQVGTRAIVGPMEAASLRSLRRGVFARHPISAGTKLRPENYYLAFPPTAGQLVANDLSKFRDFIALADVTTGAPLMLADLREEDHRALVRDILRDVKAQLRASHVTLPSARSDLELSHHYGLNRFRQCGVVALLFVNRTYCKKLLLMLPGQVHPEHRHVQKEETFIVLHGKLRVVVDHIGKMYGPGDSVLVERGVLHGFATTEGCVFEEISSTHYPDDSFYTDETITANPQRKTLLTHWMD